MGSEVLGFVRKSASSDWSDCRIGLYGVCVCVRCRGVGVVV